MTFLPLNEQDAGQISDTLHASFEAFFFFLMPKRLHSPVSKGLVQQLPVLLPHASVCLQLNRFQSPFSAIIIILLRLPAVLRRVVKWPLCVLCG